MMKHFSLLLCVAFSFNALAQSTLSTAETQYELGSFKEAIRSYQVALSEQPNNMDIVVGIAKSYAHLNDLKEAARWYERVVKSDNVSPEEWTEYGQVLKQLKLYDQAKPCFEKVAMIFPEDGQRLVNSCSFAKENMARPMALEVQNPHFNTTSSDFAPAVYKDQLVFTSFRSDIAKSRKASFTSMINGGQGSDVFAVSRTTPGDVQLLLDDIQNHAAIGPIAFSSNQKWVAITKNNFVEDQKFFQADRAQMSIYLAAVLSDGTWDKRTPYPFNDNSFSTGFPWLSDDGNEMIFSSDMPGGHGGYDLYVTSKEGNSWSAPQNLGPQINTKGNELAPYKAQDQLYFSSDHYIGFGGYDVFAYDYPSTQVTNLGLGVNSARDDIGYVFDPVQKMGYVSSDRMTSRGGVDIFKVIGQSHEVTVVVKDRNSKEPVANAEVTFKLSNVTMTTDENGMVSININDGLEEEAVIYTPGYYQLRLKLNNRPSQKHFMKYEVLVEKLENEQAQPKKELFPVVNKAVEKVSDNPNVPASTPPPSRINKEVLVDDTPSVLPVSSDVHADAPKKKVYVRMEPVEKFAIQVSAFSKGSFDPNKYSRLTSVGEVYDFSEANMTKIRVGYFHDKASASQSLKEVKNMGYRDAFVVSEIVNPQKGGTNTSAGKGNATGSEYFVDNTDYKVRLATYSQAGKFDAGKVSHLGRLESYRKNNMTIMLLAGYRSLKDAELALKAARMNGFGDAYIVKDMGGYLEKIKD